MEAIDNKRETDLKQLKKDVKERIGANRKEILKARMRKSAIIATAAGAVVGGLLGGIVGVPALAFVAGNPLVVPSFAVGAVFASSVLLGASVGNAAFSDKDTIYSCRSAIKQAREKLKGAQKVGNENSREVNETNAATIEKISPEALSGFFKGGEIEPVANSKSENRGNVNAGQAGSLADTSEDESGAE